MIFRILANSFRRSRRSKVIAFAALAIASAIGTVVLAIGASLGDRVRQDLSSYGANIVVRPETQQTEPSILGAALPAPPEAQTFAESGLGAFTRIFWKNNITGVSPALRFEASIAGRATALEGVDFRRSRSFPDGALTTGIRIAHPAWKLVAGRWPDDSATEAVAGRRLAKARGWPLGGTIEASGPGGARSLRLVGLLATGDREDEELLLPLSLAQSIAGEPGRISRIDVVALTTPESQIFDTMHRDPRTLPPAEFDRWYCTPYASSVALNIAESIPGTRATPVRRVTAAEQRAAHVAEVLLLFAGAAALAAAFLAVFATLYDSVTERAPEIGLWKALGAEPEKVAAVFLAEAAINGLLGGVAGALLGLAVAPGIARAIFGVSIARSIPLAATAVAVAVAIAIGASVRPIWRALALDPIRALREA
jgi:putative ABC transport system permease protein